MVLRIGCGRCQVVLNYVLALICTSKVSWTGDLLWPVLKVGEVSIVIGQISICTGQELGTKRSWKERSEATRSNSTRVGDQ